MMFYKHQSTQLTCLKAQVIVGYWGLSCCEVGHERLLIG